MDTLICGQCRTSFHDLHEFVDHKNNGCEDVQNAGEDMVDTKATNEKMEVKQEHPEHEGETQQIVFATADDNQDIIMDSSILVLSQEDVSPQQFKDGEKMAESKWWQDKMLVIST